MKTILIDTNFLVECAKNKIDIHEGLTKALDTSFTIGILDRTLEELDVIIARGKNPASKPAYTSSLKLGREGQAAKLAKTILMTKQVKIYPTEGGHTDNLLLKRANEDIIIATVDKELKNKLKKRGQDVVIIRGKKKIELIKS